MQGEHTMNWNDKTENQAMSEQAAKELRVLEILWLMMSSLMLVGFIVGVALLI
jgi:hypothetical protein